MIRVQADKLDQLIDLVGELVIAGASANLLAVKSRQSDLVEATSVLSLLVENIRDSALQLRMVQIGATFNKFQRVVRDVSREIGKDIRLEIDGGVKVDNIRRIADAGADTFVAGSAIFGQPDYAAVIADMRRALAG